nr:hypothetical protein [Tanacetum cinerariifolium]
MSNTLHNAIMEAGSKDRPPMLAPGSQITTTERIREPYKNVSQDIRDQLNAEAEAVQIILTGIDNDIYSTVDACPNACWKEKAVLDSKGNPTTATQKVLETYKSVMQEIRDQLNAEAEAIQIILTGIDNDIYSTVDACLNALNVQFLLQLQPEWQRFVTLVKQSQEMNNVSYHKLYDIRKQHQHEVNEIRAKKIARIANPLALVAQQQQVYHPQTHPTQYNQNSSTRTQAATRNRGKALVNSSQPIYDHEPSMVDDDEDTSKDKDIDKLMALISLSFKKIYKPTNNNLQVMMLGLGRLECQKLKRAKDAAYHSEKMLLCKQEEAGIQLNAEQADWKDDIDDEYDDQELEAHYMYMANIQEVSPDAVDSGPIFDKELE